MKILSLIGHSDKELIDAMKRGESWALKKLFTANYDTFTSWSKRTFKLDTEVTQDIYQDSVIITYENIMKGKLDNISSSLNTYLFAVAKNLIREHIRREIRLSNEEAGIIQEFYQHPQPSTDLPEDLLTSVKLALSDITEPCKSILTLFYYQDKSIEEIAAVLGYKDKSGVKTQKSRCLKYLRENMSFKW